MPTVGDYDGDGVGDLLLSRPVRASGADNGEWTAYRFAQHHMPRNTITAITNGLNATTRIDYAPLTYADVYRRDYNAPFMTSGRGAPVFDVASPLWVVSRVRGSAPTAADPNAISELRYRYAGLKMQAGGRGSLGFRQLATFDPQTRIETVNEYHQAWPLSGRALHTETRLLGSAWSTPCDAS